MEAPGQTHVSPLARWELIKGQLDAPSVLSVQSGTTAVRQQEGPWDVWQVTSEGEESLDVKADESALRQQAER